MLINQGNGVFPKTAIPPTWQTQGQHISPIDFDLDGKTDFIVLNGFGGFEGSVQLIKFPCKTLTLPDSCYGIRGSTCNHEPDRGFAGQEASMAHFRRNPTHLRKLEWDH
jgi:hypothetical protein